MTMNDKMGNLNAPGVSGKVTYHDGELFLLDELHNAEEISVIPMDMRVFIFVLQGEASFVFNEKVCTLHGHELFVSMANNVLSRWKSSEDFRCRCICASSAYTQRIVNIERAFTKQYGTTVSVLVWLQGRNIVNRTLYYIVTVAF